jgi:HK97 gp10 family phage protein
MADDSVRVLGLDALKDKLQALPRQMRVRVLRNALTAGARLVRDDAKRNAPVLSNARQTPYRQTGTLRKAISVRTSKRDRKAGDVGVFVNVRPATGGARGAKSRTDPFYWRFLEFGWNPPRRNETKRHRRALNRTGAAKTIPGRRFLSRAADKLPAALKVFEEALGRWIGKVQASGRVDP